MDAPHKFGAKGSMNRAVSLYSAHRSEGGGTKNDPEMAFAAVPIPGMPAMRLALVHDLEPFWGKSSPQQCLHLCAHTHFFQIPLQSAGN